MGTTNIIGLAIVTLVVVGMVGFFLWQHFSIKKMEKKLDRNGKGEKEEKLEKQEIKEAKQNKQRCPYNVWVEYAHVAVVATLLVALIYHYWSHPFALQLVGSILGGFYLVGAIGPLIKSTLLRTGWWKEIQPGRAVLVVRGKNAYRMIYNPNLPDKQVYFRDARFNTTDDYTFWHVCKLLEINGERDLSVLLRDTDTHSYAIGGRVPAPLRVFWWVTNPLRVINWWLATWGIVWVGAFGVQTTRPYLFSRWKPLEEAVQKGQTWDEEIKEEGVRLVRVTDTSDHFRFFPFPLLFVFQNLELGDGRHVTLVLEGRFVVFNPDAAAFKAEPSFAEITEGTLKQIVAAFLLRLQLEDMFPHMHGAGKATPEHGFVERLADEVNTRFAADQLRMYGITVFQFVVIVLAPDQATLVVAKKIPDAKVQRDADKISAEGNKALAAAPLEAAREAVLAGLPADVARATVLQNTPGAIIDVGGQRGGNPLVTAAAAKIVNGK